MVFTFDEQKQIEQMKAMYKADFEKQRHENRIKELELELKIAEVSK